MSELRERAKQEARDRITRHAEALFDLSRRIHAYPELGFQEVKASGWLVEALRASGYEVRPGIHDLPTAFGARAGRGPLQVAICAEYDALPEIGHACGHNLIAAMAVGAAIGLRDVADEVGLSVHVIGTPAEEQGNGKAMLLERGAFADAHAAMMVHPAPADVIDPPLLAFTEFDVEYHGRVAHALYEPETARSAQNALVIAQVAIGLLRQTLRPTDRVHGISGACDHDPSYIAEKARASYMVRGRTRVDLAEVEERVRRCFEAGALATETQLTITHLHDAYADMLHDVGIAGIYKANAESLGRWFPDLGDLLAYGTGSSDMGNVSQEVPSIHPAIGIESLPAVNHQPEFTEYCVTPAAERALIDGAVAMAWTAIDLAAEGPVRERLMRARELR